MVRGDAVDDNVLDVFGNVIRFKVVIAGLRKLQVPFRGKLF